MVTIVRAPNPSPMTLDGTNSYLIDCGAGRALALDPGPDIAAHVDALIQTAERLQLEISAIAVTHGHPDHAPAARTLADRTHAPVHAHPASAIPHDVDLRLEGELRVGEARLRVIDAPGHSFDHVVLYAPTERALFTGDVILGEGSVLIAAPAGAMRPYQRTLERLRDEFPQARTIYGGHGPVVTGARAKIDEYIAHRLARESELLAMLDAKRAMTIPELVIEIYGAARSPLWPAMARQLLAHLIALQSEGRVVATELLRPMTPAETAILNPPLREVVGDRDAALVEAELGADLRLEALSEYRLAPTP